MTHLTVCTLLHCRVCVHVYVCVCVCVYVSLSLPLSLLCESECDVCAHVCVCVHVRMCTHPGPRQMRKRTCSITTESNA